MIPGTLPSPEHRHIYGELCQASSCSEGPAALEEVSGCRTARSLRMCWSAAHLEGGPRGGNRGKTRSQGH